MSLTAPSALIVGASRGLGLALAQEFSRRGWNTVGTVRSSSPELDAAIAGSSKRLRSETVDITDDTQLADLRSRLSGERFNLVFINAGINRSDGTINEASVEEFIDVMTTNAVAPMRALETLRDLVIPGGTVGVMSSEQGSITRNTELGFEVYKASKAALNQLMRSYATRHIADGHTKLLIDPGHNQTALGGMDAPFSPADSIPLIADVIESASGRGDLQFLDRNGDNVPW